MCIVNRIKKGEESGVPKSMWRGQSLKVAEINDNGKTNQFGRLEYIGVIS
jgi:hypothetical protein